MLVLYTQMT